MSGQLVGDVIRASPRLRANGLSRNGFLALIAIAEKSHARTRQGAVRWDHICDGLYGASKRTAKRAVRELREADLIQVVKPGWGNQHGDTQAPIYEVRMGSQVASSKRVDGDRSELDGDKSEVDGDKHPPATSASSTLDGSIDGSSDGGARAHEEPATPEPQQSGDAPPRCNRHKNHTDPPPCNACKKLRIQWEDMKAAEAELEKRIRARDYERTQNCPHCDQGWKPAGDGVVKCLCRRIQLRGLVVTAA